MFQTFSGSSRRPRQVNLSGQNTNPFAASSWTPAVSGTQKTVAHAQQERQQRQQERERLSAAKRIQRTWRGHKVRSDLADSRRKVWDSENVRDGNPKSVSKLVGQLQLFLAFFNARRRDDLERLLTLCQCISIVGYGPFLNLLEIQPCLPRLAKVTLDALTTTLPACPNLLLQLLTGIVFRRPRVMSRISQSYYSYLASLLVQNRSGALDPALIMAAIKEPLIVTVGTEENDQTYLGIYAAFALYFLSTSDLPNLLGRLDDVAEVVNIDILSAALIREFISGSAEKCDADSRLWLLAHFIALHRLQQRDDQKPEFLKALSLQLSSSSGEIMSRIGSKNNEIHQEATKEDHLNPVLPLPSFIEGQLSSLVDQNRITGLLVKFNIDYAKASSAGEEDASLLASYALTLLRIFPSRSDEIRMWLYLGYLTTSTGARVPALKFFWQAMCMTTTFSGIKADSKYALTILRPQKDPQHGLMASNDLVRDRDWRTILLFLELYTFVLRFTDDEEFLSGSTLNLRRAESPISRIRESALPLEDVKQLTLFLKNLAFTTYYNAGELSDDDQNLIEGGLDSYFGTNPTFTFQSDAEEEAIKRMGMQPFAGIAGMTFNYVRTIVSGVMRMLYERNSRRPFLPKDHWLMTSRFDMQGFIPAVVMEEERQHEMGEDEADGYDDSDDPSFQIPSESNRGIVGMSLPRRALRIEMLRRRQQKAARKKVLAAVGPRLEVLQNMPFVIPFETRVQIFRQFVYLDQIRRRGGHVDPDIWRMSQAQQDLQHGLSPREALGRHHAKIRRDSVFDDAYEQFYDLGEGLKEPIQITFVDQFDTVEAGIDGGGVTKEFLTSVTNEAFRAENGPNMFVANDQNLLYPNPVAIDERCEWLTQAGLDETCPEWHEDVSELLRQFEFLGRIVGKCLYEGILVDIGFAGFFLLKWAASGSGHDSGYRANINDLRDLDESLYQGLLKLKNYAGDVEDFSLDFTITDTIPVAGGTPKIITRDLMPNGSNIPVTNENRLLYVSYVARYRLQLQPFQQTQAFLKGLREIIKPSWLSMFNQSELQTLIGGDSSQINVEDLRRNTQYGGVYQIGDDGLEHETVQAFWKVMKELEDADRRKVLKYVTSTPRAPLLGFSQLNPRFSIRDAGNDETRLPSTSTCVNLLKLPRYSTADVLKAKLLYAVNSGAGFDLS
ncbi:hypothetical protein B7494_g2098 [Chlorociboria aeruginascens]|nr:hypothetical protein B7494_g2098 [Chlorociboria aeruginascens]